MILAAGQLQRPDHIVLVGYFILMLGVGVYFYRYMQGMKDYFRGGNQIPWWLSGVSFYMSSFSAQTFVQYSTLAYLYGWVAVTLYWVTVPAVLIGAIILSGRWRRARIDSPVEYLETRYSSSVRQIFAWQGISVRLIDDALKLIAIGLILSPVLGWSMQNSMLAAGLIMLAYTFLGGLWAVTVTDFVQFIVMSAGVIVLVPLALAKTGGLAAFVDNAGKGFFQLTQPSYGWVYIGCNIILFSLALNGPTWSLIQRYYCVPAEKDARKVGGLVVVLNIIGPPLMFLPAMAASQFLPEIENKGQVYATLCLYLLPAGMVGLIIAAMFSATMSMLSSDFNACASVLTNDIYRRLICPGASQRRLVWVGRFMTMAIGLTALTLALLIGDVGGEELFRSMIKLFSIATAPVAIPMIAGLLSARVTNAGALTGFLVGATTGVLLFLVCPDTVEILTATLKKESLILLATTASTSIFMCLVSWLNTPDAAARRRVESFMEKLALPIGELAEDRMPTAGREMISPFRVVGVCTVLIGVLLLGVLPFVEDGPAFTTDMVIGATLVVLGGTMLLRSLLPGKPGET